MKIEQPIKIIMAKSVTLTDIAKEAGVGVITVSRALRGIGRVNQQTRERILKLADEMGYTRTSGVLTSAPARPGSDEHKLDLVLPAFMGDMDRISGPFGEEIARGLQDQLSARGGTLHVVPASGPEDITRYWPRKKIHGIILRHAIPCEWMDILKQFGPVVYPVAENVHCGVDSVNYDEDKSVAMILQHLLKAGHTHILCLGYIYHRKDTHLPAELFNLNNPVDRLTTLFYGNRLGAWKVAQEKMRGLAKIQIKLIRSTAASADFDRMRDQALDYYQNLSSKPTAIVLLTSLATGFLTRAAKRGLFVNNHFSLITYQPQKGDHWQETDISGIRLPTYDIGRAIPEIIERRLAMPDARPVSLNFECSWHTGRTLQKH